MKYVIAAATAILICSPVAARPHLDYTLPDRHAVSPGNEYRTALRVQKRSAGKKRMFRRRHYDQPLTRSVKKVPPTIVAHPAGCPRTRFCGCGVSMRVYGERRRNLYLAANWLKFPVVKPAPGMVAARRGHVFFIEKVHADRVVLAYDPNSGGHRTRVHLRSLRGYTVVDPRG